MPYIGNQHNVGDHINNFKVLDDISSYTATFDGSATSAVDTTNNTIRVPLHRFIQGQRVTYTNGSGGNIGGLTTGTAYFISFDSANTVKLATSLANANNNTVINLSSVGSGTSHTLNAAFDGVNTKFKLTHGSGTAARLNNATQINVAINNVVQRPNLDPNNFTDGFALEDNHKIVFQTAPTNEDIFWGSIIANTIENFDLRDNEVDNFTGNGSATDFNLSTIPANNESVIVTIDGVLQHPSDKDTTRAYTLLANVIQFSAAPALNAEIQVRHIGFAGASTNDVSGFYGRTGNVTLTSNDNITVGSITASGSVSIGGTLTYEDVTNIDSVGLITARDGIKVGTGITFETNGQGTFSGIVTSRGYEVSHSDSTPTHNYFKAGRIRIFDNGSHCHFRFGDHPSYAPHQHYSSNYVQRTNAWYLQNTAATRYGITWVNNDGPVNLWYSKGYAPDYSIKLSTTAKGITVGSGVTIETNGQATFSGITTFSGNVHIPQGKDLKFGNNFNSPKLFLSYDGSVCRMQAPSDGIFIGGTVVSLKSGNYNERMLEAVHNGAVTLYYDSSAHPIAKLTTTATGITVDGTTTTTGLGVTSLAVAGITTMSGDLTISSSLPRITLNDTNHESDFDIKNENGSFRIRDLDNPTDRYRINSSGGTIHEFFGVADFNSHLTVDGNITSGGEIKTLTLFESTSGNDLRLNAGSANRDIFLQVNDTTLMTVRGSTGNVGIVTTVPQSKLELDGRFRILDNSDGTPSTGKGLEISYYTSDDMADILSYDRGGSAYKKLQLRGSSIELKKNNSAKIIVGTGGNGNTVGFSTTLNMVTGAEAISVRGYSSFKSSNAAYAAIYLASEGTTDNVANQLLMFNAGGANRGGIGYVPNTGELRFNHQYYMTFCTGSSIMGGTERIRISAGGETKFTVGTNKTVKFYAASHNDESNLGAGLGFSRQSDGAELLSGIFGHSNSGLGVAARDHVTILTGGSSNVSDTEERLRITSTGLVGIGTNNPGATLTVQSDSSNTSLTGHNYLASQSGIILQNRTSSSGHFTAYTGNVSSSGGYTQSGSLAFESTGSGFSPKIHITQRTGSGVQTKRLTIDANGGFIINDGGSGGTADVNADNFVVKNYASNASCGISILNADNQNSTLYFGNASDRKHAEIVWSDASNLFLIGSSNAGASIKFRTANQSDALLINSSGKIGINEVSNINGRLHVQHDGLTENILYATRYNDQGSDKPILAITEAQMTGMTASGLVIGNHNRDIQIGSVFNSSAAVSTTSLLGIRLRANGYVGINTNNPGAPLHIESHEAGLSIRRNGQYLLFDGNTGNGGDQSISSSAGFRVQTGGVGNSYERFRIKSDGKVGINQNNPTQQFVVTLDGLADNTYGISTQYRSGNNASGRTASGLQIVSSADNNNGENNTAYLQFTNRDPVLNGSHGASAFITMTTNGSGSGYGNGQFDFYCRNGAPYGFPNDPQVSSNYWMESLFTIKSNSNIGVGDTNPAAKFVVNNGTNNAQFVQMKNEEVGLFFGAYGTGSSYPREATINGSRVDAGSSPYLRVAGQGGIKFCVDLNTIRQIIDGGGRSLFITNGSQSSPLADSNVPVQIAESNGSMCYFGANKGNSYGSLFGHHTAYGGTVIRNIQSDDIVFMTNNSQEKVRIMSSGNVGINEASADTKLHISHSNATEDVIKLEATPVTAATGERSRIIFHVTQSNGQAARLAHIASHTLNGWGGELSFSTKPANSTPNNSVDERMRITASGSVKFILNGTPTDDSTSNIILGRHNSASEGGQLAFARANDNTTYWKFDCFGSGNDPRLRLHRDGYERFNFFDNGNFTSTGTITGSSKNFSIPHPLPSLKSTKKLVHASIEGPQLDLIYRGKVELVDGTATVNIDSVSGMSDGTFVALNRDVQCFTTNETGWTNVKGSVSGNVLTIIAQDNSCTDTISWMVVGERQDDIIKSLDTTDDSGNLIVEPTLEGS